jgi:transcriptional regulator with XRE-family HTH domain
LAESQFSLDNEDTSDASSKRVELNCGYNPPSAKQESPALALCYNNMATTLATVEAREVLRCEHCSLVQFRTSNSLCRRCHKPLEIEEPEPQLPQLVVPSAAAVTDGDIDVARAVRDIRHSRGMSQRQLAGRMQVPRTYISKIENAKAMPTLSSLERLAQALDVDICALLRDARSRRQAETNAIMSDPFLAEIASLLPSLDGFQKSMFLNQVREMASGRKRAQVAS